MFFHRHHYERTKNIHSVGRFLLRGRKCSSGCKKLRRLLRGLGACSPGKILNSNKPFPAFWALTNCILSASGASIFPPFLYPILSKLLQGPGPPLHPVPGPMIPLGTDTSKQYQVSSKYVLFKHMCILTDHK